MTYSSPQKILIKPIITEKSYQQQQAGKYGFFVKADATKNQIAAAFTELFSVKPVKVNTVFIKGKIKTNWRRRRPIVKPNLKKAIITLPKDKTIPLLTIKTK